MSLAAVSLIAAVPSALVVILLAYSLLNHFGNMSSTFVGLAGVALLASSMAAVLPLGIVLFGGKGVTKEKAPKEKKAKKGRKGDEPVEGTEVSSSEVAAAIATDDDDTDFVVADPDAGVSTGELSVVEGAFTEDDLPALKGAVSDPNIDVFEDDSLEEFGGIEIDDDEKKA